MIKHNGEQSEEVAVKSIYEMSFKQQTVCQDVRNSLEHAISFKKIFDCNKLKRPIKSATITTGKHTDNLTMK